MKTLKTFLGQDHFVPFSALPSETKEDIAGWFMENEPRVAEASKGYTEYALQDLDVADSLGLRVFRLPLNKLTGYRRDPSRIAVKKYAAMLTHTEAPPILVDGTRFIDGGHRVTAYRAAGRKDIPAVDIGPLIRMNWEAWLAGIPDHPSFPLFRKGHK